jgi:hypothetical protein
MHVAEMTAVPMLSDAGAAAPGSTYPGYHIVWEGFPVSPDKALLIRCYVIDFLMRAFDETNAGVPWDRIVDGAVYTGSGRGGIRMLYQSKFAGQINVGRKYDYVGFYDAAENRMVNLYSVNEERAMEVMSVRRPTAMGMVPSGPGGGGGGGSSPVTGVKRARTAKPQAISNDDPRVQLLEDYLRNAYFDGNADFRVTSVKPFAKGYVAETNCKFCPCYKKEHHRSTQYFTVFQGTGFTQKCRCMCDGRDCRQWTGRKLAFRGAPRDLRNLLFPSVEKHEKSGPAELEAAKDLDDPLTVQRAVERVSEANATEADRYKDALF